MDWIQIYEKNSDWIRIEKLSYPYTTGLHTHTTQLLVSSEISDFLTPYMRMHRVIFFILNRPMLRKLMIRVQGSVFR